MNIPYSKWTAVREGSEHDNFETSIYVDDYKGLLIARCDQNGERPWLVDLIVNAPKNAARVKELEEKLRQLGAQ